MKPYEVRGNIPFPWTSQTEGAILTFATDFNDVEWSYYYPVIASDYFLGPEYSTIWRKAYFNSDLKQLIDYDTGAIYADIEVIDDHNISLHFKKDMEGMRLVSVGDYYDYSRIRAWVNRGNPTLQELKFGDVVEEGDTILLLSPFISIDEIAENYVLYGDQNFFVNSLNNIETDYLKIDKLVDNKLAIEVQTKCQWFGAYRSIDAIRTDTMDIKIRDRNGIELPLGDSGLVTMVNEAGNPCVLYMNGKPLRGYLDNDFKTHISFSPSPMPNPELTDEEINWNFRLPATPDTSDTILPVTMMATRFDIPVIIDDYAPQYDSTYLVPLWLNDDIVYEESITTGSNSPMVFEWFR